MNPVSGQEIVQIITLITGLISTLAIPFVAYYIRRLEKNTNSIKDELVAVTKSAAIARGNLEGRAELKEEIKTGA